MPCSYPTRFVSGSRCRDVNVCSEFAQACAGGTDGLVNVVSTWDDVTPSCVLTPSSSSKPRCCNLPCSSLPDMSRSAHSHTNTGGISQREAAERIQRIWRSRNRASSKKYMTPDARWNDALLTVEMEVHAPNSVSHQPNVLRPFLPGLRYRCAERRRQRGQDALAARSCDDAAATRRSEFMCASHVMFTCGPGWK